MRAEGARLGLRKRLICIFAVGALLLSASVAAISYELSRRYLVRQRQTSLEQQTYVSARLIRSRLRAGEPDVRALLASLSPRGTSEHLLLDGGQWTAGSPTAEPAFVPEALREAVERGHAAHQLIRVDDTPSYTVGVPIVETGMSYFAVYPLKVLERTLQVLRNSLLVAAAITTLLGAAAGWWASRRVLGPLSDVANAAAAVAGGHLDARLEASHDPDLATVATAFNQMTEALQTRIQRDARFASAVSHELRSPLATLLASAEVVGARRDELPPPARKALDLLSAEVVRLCRVVEDLLEISRFDAGVSDVAMEDVRLDEFVERAVGATASAAVPIEVDPAVDGTLVRVDKRRLERVVGNLIVNAEHYAGGVARVSVERRDGNALICVEDAGPGVPLDERQAIFGRFVRGRNAGRHRPGSGAGLGLSLVAEHVRAHHGRVWVEDRAGGGARFVVELPVAP